jgi:adenylate kinase
MLPRLLLALLPLFAPSARSQIAVSPLPAEPVIGLSIAPDAAQAASPEPAGLFDGAAIPAAPVPIEPALSAQKPLRLAIAGPPGSGKGTHASYIARDFGVVHVATGDLLREHAKTDPVVADQMRRGLLVDAALVRRLVRERLARPDALEKGYILDGFPRRLSEAESLPELLGGERLDAVIFLDVPEEELLRRILHRGRTDDSEAVFRERMRVYREETLPAITKAREGTATLVPDLSGPDKETNYRGIREALERLLGRTSSAR